MSHSVCRFQESVHFFAFKISIIRLLSLACCPFFSFKSQQYRIFPFSLFSIITWCSPPFFFSFSSILLINALVITLSLSISVSVSISAKKYILPSMTTYSQVSGIWTWVTLGIHYSSCHKIINYDHLVSVLSLYWKWGCTAVRMETD